MSAYGKKMVTPLIESGACVYLNYDELGIAKCAIQKAHEEGVVDWPKPVSCHLYPIRIEKYEDFDAVNYFRWDICKAACTLGKEHCSSHGVMTVVVDELLQCWTYPETFSFIGVANEIHAI